MFLASNTLYSAGFGGCRFTAEISNHSKRDSRTQSRFTAPQLLRLRSNAGLVDIYPYMRLNNLKNISCTYK